MMCRVPIVAVGWLLVAVMAGAAPPPRPVIHVADTPLAFTATAWPENLAAATADEGATLAGTPLLTNGLVAVAVTPPGLLLFSHDENGRGTVRARLAMLGADGDEATAFRSAKLLEAGRTVVSVQVTWATPRQEITATVSLRRGSVTCDISPGNNARAVRMADPEPAAIVVPAFHGDDFLFVPEDCAHATAFIPSELLVLWLVDDGQAIVQAVWNPPAEDQDGGETMVEATVAERDGRRVIAATTITFSGQPLFFAAWQGQGLWAKVAVDDSFGAVGQSRDVRIAWQAPFPAVWQAIVHAPDNYTSWNLRERRDQGMIGAHGREIHYTWPFWQEQGGYWLHLPPEQIHQTRPDYVLIYPLQRHRQTPAAVKLPEDILRESLKTGVCAHLFKTGGGGNPGGPLCVLIRRFGILAQIYADTGRSSDLLAAHAQWIYDQGEHQYRRLHDYAAFGEQVVALAAAAGREHPELATELAQVAANGREITEFCRQVMANGSAIPAGFRDFRPKAADPTAAMAELLAEIKVRMAERSPDNLARWQDLAGKLNRMAILPQTALPRPRALARAVQNRATRLAVASPAAAKIAAEMRNLAQSVLRDRHWAEQER